MRSRKLSLTEILKVGLSPNRGVNSGFEMLKNIRTDGQSLVGCPTESVSKLAVACTPFAMNQDDYYIRASNIYSLGSGIPLKVCTFVGSPKIVNLIEVAWIQDDSLTYVMDRQGIYTVNPSGNQIPLCNSIVVMNGQILVGGIVSGLNNLGKGTIAWSDIALDRFTIDKSNTAGFYNPNIGEVYNILPLQDSAIVLGSAGACQMYYAGNTFGFRDLDIPLLKSKGLCASSTNKAIYVAQDGSVVSVDKNGEATILGYSWIGKSVVKVQYLNGRNLFAFTDTVTTHLLDSKGLFGYGYKIWGEFNKTLGVIDSFEQNTFEFQTALFDLGRVGEKFIDEVAIQDSLKYPADTRYIEVFESDGGLSQGLKILNSFNASKYPIAGEGFKLFYRSNSEPSITRIDIEYQAADKRFGGGYTPYSGGTKNVY